MEWMILLQDICFLIPRTCECILSDSKETGDIVKGDTEMKIISWITQVETI